MAEPFDNLISFDDSIIQMSEQTVFQGTDNESGSFSHESRREILGRQQQRGSC
jgi:hypothetical protein